MKLFLRLTISPMLFYYSLTCLQLLTRGITRFFCRDRLYLWYYINGKALRCFKSYLENRKQVVNVRGATSYSKDLRFGVFQGSVLVPIVYCTRPRLATLSEVMAYYVISTLMTPSLTAHSSFMIKRLQCKQLSLV